MMRLRFALFMLVSLPVCARAQQAHALRWWEIAIAAGTVGAVSVFDHRVDQWFQDQRSASSDDVARVFRHGGQPEVTFVVPGAMLATGLLSHNKNLTRSGGRVLAAVLVAGGMTVGAKLVVGRVRPSDTTYQYVFRPFTHHDSFPSGHTTMAFALAASLADEIHRPWATALLYTGAAGTGWSRLNDHRHWLSDVLAGAAVGVTGAKLVNGRWRVFGIRPPRFLVSPAGSSRIEWRAEF